MRAAASSVGWTPEGRRIFDIVLPAEDMMMLMTVAIMTGGTMVMMVVARLRLLLLFLLVLVMVMVTVVLVFGSD